MNVGNMRFGSVLYLQSFKKDGQPVMREEETYGMIDGYIHRQRLFGKTLDEFSPPAFGDESLRQYIAVNDAEGDDLTTLKSALERSTAPPFSDAHQAMYAPFIAKARPVELNQTTDSQRQVQHYRIRPLTQK